METLERQVRRARRRLIAASLGSKLAWCWFVALWAAALAIAVGKLWTPVAGTAWAAGAVVAALALGLVAAITWTWARRHDPLDAAAEIDRRFGLKERVASALALAPDERETAIGRALVQDASQQMRGVDVAERFRLRPKRRTLLPLVPAAVAFVLAAIVPMRTPEVPAGNAASQAAQTRQSTQSLARKIETQRQEAAKRGLKELDPLLARLEAGALELSKTAENDRQKSLVALNDLAKELEKRRHELGASGDMKKQLAGLKDLHTGPAEKFGQALKAGNFEKAAELLDKLQKDLAADSLDADAQKALAQQLKQLQEALAERRAAHEKLAQQLQQQLEQERRAGNKDRAAQLQDQLDKLEAQKPAMENLAQMESDLQRAAACMENGQCDKAGDALANVARQLAGMQQEMQEMEMLDGALDQMAQCKQAMGCKQCDGQGCGACQGDQWHRHDGPLDPFARRGGGKGIGVGLGPGLLEETNPDGKFYDSAVKQQPGQGPAKVVGEAAGPNRKGRVEEAIQTEFAQSPQKAAEALSEHRLPRDYRDHAKTYFDSLREGTR